MRTELLLLALVVGLATWILRFAPTKLPLAKADGDGPLRRFFAATGPAAIATLLTASILPYVTTEANNTVPLSVGIVATLLVYATRRSVVLATLAGALGYGVGYSLFQ